MDAVRGTNEFGVGMLGSLCVAASAVFSEFPCHLPPSKVNRTDFCSGPASEKAGRIKVVIRLSFTRSELWEA